MFGYCAFWWVFPLLFMAVFAVACFLFMRAGKSGPCACMGKQHE
jgi:hypothetical protein